MKTLRILVPLGNGPDYEEAFEHGETEYNAELVRLDNGKLALYLESSTQPYYERDDET